MSGFISRVSTIAQSVKSLSRLDFGSTGGVTLGDFAFNGFEVPDSINFGGDMAMTVHKLPGGERVIDLMGDDPADISWSGTIMDGDPVKRAQQLDQMRLDGEALPLVWGTFFYSVIIRRFEARVMYGRVGYSITCCVLQNEAAMMAENEPGLTEVAQGGALGALQSVSDGLQKAASVIHQGVEVASRVATEVSRIAGAVGISIPFLGKAQEALGMANGLSAQIGSIGSATSDTIASLSAGSATMQDGAGEMGGVLSDISSDAPTGSLVGSADDLQAASYASGQQAQMLQAGADSGAAAVSMTAATGGDTSVAVSDMRSGTDASLPPATFGPPNSTMSYTATQINASGDPTQSLYLAKTVTYDSGGNATVSYQPQPAKAGQLTAADRKAAGF